MAQPLTAQQQAEIDAANSGDFRFDGLTLRGHGGAYNLNPLPYTVTSTSGTKADIASAQAIGTPPQAVGLFPGDGTGTRDPIPGNPYAGEEEEGGGGSTTGTDTTTNEVLAGIGAGNKIFAHGGRNAGPAMAIMGEGENFNPLGGAQGKSNYEKAYDPNPTINAMMNAEDAKKDRNEALLKHYGDEVTRQQTQMAALQAQRQKDQVEDHRRQAVLEQSVTRYTDDLHNQNKFWENPGNIVSAIAFSLMPIFSNDPAVGAKLINQAIDRDLASRKSTADMHLGELRSNLGSYRKMVGDRQAGDLLAESEARRVVAMDIERIGAQFESPISKSRTMILAEDERRKSAALAMQAYRQGAYVQPHVERQGIVDAYKAGGGYTPYGVQPGTTGSAVRGSVSGTPSTASDTQTKKSTLSPTRATALIAKPEEAVKQAQADTITPDDMYELVNQGLKARVASYKIPGSPGFNEEFEKRRKDAEAGMQKIALAAAPAAARQAALSSLQQDMNVIGNFYAKHGKNPDSFFDDLRTGMGSGNAEWVRDMQQRYSTPGSPEAKEVKEWQKASNRLYQKLAGELLGFKSKMIGGSQSTQELAGVAEYITLNPSWSKFSGFVRNESMKSQAEYRNAIKHGDGPEAKLLWLAEHKGAALPALDNPAIPTRKK